METRAWCRGEQAESTDGCLGRGWRTATVKGCSEAACSPFWPPSPSFPDREKET